MKTKIEIKQDVQNKLMHAMMNAFIAMGDKGEDPNGELMREARKQAARVEKLFGYDPYSWSY